MALNNEMARMAAAMQAQMLQAHLAEAMDGRLRFTDREMVGSAVRLDFIPPIKEVVRQVSFSCGQHMTQFCVEAVIEKVQRLLAERIEADREAA